MDTKTIGTKNPLEHADWAVPPLHIPDGKGGCYKTELVLSRSKEQVQKIHWWHAPDPRREPHSHPWPFESKILAGGYTETRYYLLGDAKIVGEEKVTYREGDTNHMYAGVFHTVDEVLPGTVTHMVCGALIADGDWGYLINGRYVSTKDDPHPNADFLEQLRAINPHKRG